MFLLMRGSHRGRAGNPSRDSHVRRGARDGADEKSLKPTIQFVQIERVFPSQKREKLERVFPR
jgi:hypothetical protein